MAVYVDKPEVRFQLRIQDSCNWCCCRRVDDDTKMYINSKGKVVPFDPQKAEDEIEAMQRSVQHLENTIYKMAEQTKLDEEKREMAILDLKQKIDVVLKEAPSPREGVPKEITIGMVGRINEAIQSVFGNGSDY